MAASAAATVGQVVPTTFLSVQDLYDLYMTKELRTVIKYTQDPGTPGASAHGASDVHMSPPRPTLQSVTALTPFSEQLAQSIATPDRPEFIRGLLQDDEDIQDLESLDDMEDPDYVEKMENSGLGFFVEDFLSFHGRCPVCKQKTLRKYSISNMPVIDLICINKRHHIKTETPTCFLYQVKIKVGDSKYFNYANKYINIGSKAKGYNSHEVSSSRGIKPKLVVIGYICLKLDETTYDHRYIINKRESFTIVPKYTDYSFPTELFYEYFDKDSQEYRMYKYFNHNPITWSKKFNNVTLVNDLFDEGSKATIVDTNEAFFEQVLDNPYKKIPGYIFGQGWKNMLVNTRLFQHYFNK